MPKENNRSQPMQPHNMPYNFRKPQQNGDTGDIALQPKTPRAVQANVPKASSTTFKTGAYIPPALRNKARVQPVAFAVQLYPDMSTLTLANHNGQQASTVAFSGHPPPDHHNNTALHHYIAHVCKDAEAFSADVWLDTFHITLGDLELPMSKIQEFQRAMDIAVRSLPPVTSLKYTTTDLHHTIKEDRLQKEIKGEHFYCLALAASQDQLEEVLQPWMTAVQNAAHAVGAKFISKPFSSHHMAVRCHTKARVGRQSFQNAQTAVRCQPISFRAAGIRVQSAASQALERCGHDHIRTFTGSDGSQVRYPVPIYISGEAASVLLERGTNTHQATETQAAVEAMNKMLL